MAGACPSCPLQVCRDSCTTARLRQGFSRWPSQGSVAPKIWNSDFGKDWRSAAAPKHLALFLWDCKEIFRYPPLPSLGHREAVMDLTCAWVYIQAEKINKSWLDFVFHVHDKKETPRVFRCHFLISSQHWVTLIGWCPDLWCNELLWVCLQGGGVAVHLRCAGAGSTGCALPSTGGDK